MKKINEVDWNYISIVILVVFLCLILMGATVYACLEIQKVNNTIKDIEETEASERIKEYEKIKNYTRMIIEDEIELKTYDGIYFDYSEIEDYLKNSKLYIITLKCFNGESWEYFSYLFSDSWSDGLEYHDYNWRRIDLSI